MLKQNDGKNKWVINNQNKQSKTTHTTEYVSGLRFKILEIKE